MAHKTVLLVVLALSLAVGSAILTAPVAAQEAPTIEEDEISVDGSTVTINTGGAASVSITNLPDGTTVSEISSGGAETDEGVLWSDLTGLPETVSFTLTPPAEYGPGDELTFDLGDDSVTLTVAGDEDDTTLVKEDEVSVSGSTITVESSDLASVSVTGLPSGSEVDAISDGGAETDEGILWSDLSGLPDTVSFTLTPPATADPGDEITFTVGDAEVTLTIVENNVPADLPSGVSDEQYLAVAGDDGLSQPALSAGVNEWFTGEDNTIDGVEFTQPELSALINYWFT